MIPADVFPEPGLVCVEIAAGWLAGDGIRAGDYIIADPARTALDGDIVIATWARPSDGTRAGQVAHVQLNCVSVGDRTGGLILVSSNPEYPDNIITPDADPRVEGVVIGAGCRCGPFTRIKTVAELRGTGG